MTLVITAVAAEAIRAILDAAALPDGSGVRFSTPAGDNVEPQLTVSTEDHPMADDIVIDEDGAVLFLDLEASIYLADKVLHAEVVRGRVRFVVDDP